MNAIDVLLIRNSWETAYPPSHCWYYKFNIPLTVPDIECATFTEVPVQFPKSVKNREEKYHELLRTSEQNLNDSVDRYNEVVYNYKGECFDKTADDRNESRETALSLTHNHISYYKGLCLFLVIKIAEEFGIESIDKHFEKQRNETERN